MKYTVESLRPKIDEFLQPLIDDAGFELSYEVRTSESRHPEVENPEVTVLFAGPDVDLLLENRAELLLALEHLTMEALRIPPEDHSLISFDANDYRMLRVEELRLSALAAADKVKKTRVPFHFSPMNSRERRILHLALRDQTEVRSESVGMGWIRQVVVVPSDMKTLPEPIRPPRPRPEEDRPRRPFGRGDRRGGPPRRTRDRPR